MAASDLIVKGIVSGCFPYGEYGKRLLILTDSQGKITVFAKGAAKQNSKLIGASRIFTLGEFTLKEGKGGAYNLCGVTVIDSFNELSVNPDCAFNAQYALEVCDYFLKEGTAPADAKSMLNLLYLTLDTIRKRELPASLIKSIFRLRILKCEGIYTETPEGGGREEQAMWDYVLKCPLTKLFDSEAWKKCSTSSFEEITALLFESQVNHKFRSESFYDIASFTSL